MKEKIKIPKGLYKCERCGEYKGVVKEEDSEEDITVSCLCNGILCPICKKNKIHRPISNYYDEETNIVWHCPWSMGTKGCDECAKKRNSK